MEYLCSAIGALIKATVPLLPIWNFKRLPTCLLVLISRSCVSNALESYLSQPYTLRGEQLNIDLIEHILNIIANSRIIAQQIEVRLLGSIATFKMCYQIVERYSVCRCLYYRHSIDPCQRYGQRGHSTTEKTVLVGYACPDHSSRRKKDDDQNQSSGNGNRQWRDSGYSSGGYQSGSPRHR